MTSKNRVYIWVGGGGCRLWRGPFYRHIQLRARHAARRIAERSQSRRFPLSRKPKRQWKTSTGVGGREASGVLANHPTAAAVPNESMARWKFAFMMLPQ